MATLTACAPAPVIWSSAMRMMVTSAEISTTLFGLWVLTGGGFHLYWFDKMACGEWDFFAIAMFFISLFPAMMLGPIMFPYGWWFYWLSGRHERIDTSDIPEVGEDWFRKAKLRRPEDQ